MGKWLSPAAPRLRQHPPATRRRRRFLGTWENVVFQKQEPNMMGRASAAPMTRGGRGPTQRRGEDPSTRGSPCAVRTAGTAPLRPGCRALTPGVGGRGGLPGSGDLGRSRAGKGRPALRGGRGAHPGPAVRPHPMKGPRPQARAPKDLPPAHPGGPLLAWGGGRIGKVRRPWGQHCGGTCLRELVLGSACLCAHLPAPGHTSACTPCPPPHPAPEAPPAPVSPRAAAPRLDLEAKGRAAQHSGTDRRGGGGGLGRG